ncbi:MAG TPA: hypothetical protein ENK52_04430 [Saprospiraceae bacterium]|nr:hypothetical protein [Saprospiraceae bacterium]
MKANILLSLIIVIFQGIFLTSLNAQNEERHETVAIYEVDTKGFTLEPTEMTNLLRTELEKLNQLDVMDQYDMKYLLQKKDYQPENCYGKICLQEIGKILKVDYMLSGSVQLLDDVIIVSLKLIDVGRAKIVKQEVIEFLNIKHQVRSMLQLTLKKMFELNVDENLMSKMTQKNDYETAVNFPETNKLNLSGPRMGVTVFSGEGAKILKDKEEVGGYDGSSVMFHFGYQFEVKYLNQGNFQALVEFIPLVTGLDQGQFIPSISILNGLRNSKMGLEFAFGPNLYVNKVADGYYDEQGDWHLKKEWSATNIEPNPNPIESRSDSRGEIKLQSAFIFAIGKTFKSGKLNIPLNVFFAPGKNASHRFGLSMGFNLSK